MFSPKLRPEFTSPPAASTGSAVTRLRPTIRPWVATAAYYSGVVGLLWAMGFLIWVYSRNLGLIVATDDLGFYGLCDDIRTGWYGVRDWKWCKNLYFFPDSLIYVPLYLGTSNVMKIYALYPAITFGLMVLAGYFVHRQLTRDRRDPLTFSLVSGSLLLVAVIGQPNTHTMYFLRPGWHGGAVLIGLVSLALAMPMVATRPSRLAWFGWVMCLGIVFLSTPSDKLFACQFAAPLAAVFVWLGVRGRIPLRRAVFLPAGILAAAVAGALAQKLLRDAGFFHSAEDPWPTWAALIKSFQQFLKDVKELVRIMPFTLLFSAAGTFLCTGAAVESCRAASGAAPDSPERRDATRWEFFTAFTVICLIATVLAPPAMGVWDSTFAQRFLMSTYAVAPLAVAVVVVARGPARSFHSGFVGLVGLVLFCIVYSYAHLPVRDLQKARLSLKHHPEVVFLNKVRPQYGLRNGFAFWEARRLTYGCETPYRVNCIQAGFFLEGWHLNIAWCLTETRPELGNGIPVYDFIFVRHTPNGTINEARLKEVCGEPAVTVREGEYAIHVYNRDSDVAFRNFSRLPALVLANRPLPVTAAEPAGLAKYHGDGYGWDGNAPDSVSIPPGSRQVIRLTESVPAKNRVCELALDNYSSFRVQFTKAGAVVGETVVPAGNGVAGLRARYLSVQKYVPAGDIDGLVVEPVSGAGPFRVGHTFVYEDSIPAK